MIETIVGIGEVAPVVVDAVAVVTVGVEDQEEAAAVEADLMTIIEAAIEIVLVVEIGAVDLMVIEIMINHGIMHQEAVAETLAAIGQTMDVIMITMIIRIITVTTIKAPGPRHHHLVVVIKEEMVAMETSRTTNKITHGMIINQTIVAAEAHGVMQTKVEVILTMIDHKDTLVIVIVAGVVVVIVVVVVATEVVTVVIVVMEVLVEAMVVIEAAVEAAEMIVVVEAAVMTIEAVVEVVAAVAVALEVVVVAVVAVADAFEETKNTHTSIFRLVKFIL